MDLARAGRYLAAHHEGVLVTIGRDGLPQSSNVAYRHVEGDDRPAGGEALISVTAGRVKTANLRRDPRCLLHVTTTGGGFGRWVAAECSAEVGPVSERPGDAVGRALLELYEAIVGREHPDRDEFHRAMVEEGRLLLRLSPRRAYGQFEG
jgi:PPOX class probable F420-dependent enzyme